MRIALLTLLALMVATPATPVLAQAPTPGSWRDMVQQLGATRRVKPVHVARAPSLALNASIVVESEPNDSIRTADSVALGDRATGVINPANDIDTWFVDLTAGQFFSVDVDAQVDGSPLDAQIVLFAPDGRTVLAFNDDFDGLDSRISLLVPASGRHVVQISSFGRNGGSPAATYALNVGFVTCAAAGTERESNDSPATATPVAIDGSGSGEICPVVERPAGDVDYWSFTAQAGTMVDLEVDATDLGFVVDPILTLYASDGTTRLVFNDDFLGVNSRLQFFIATTGTYYAAVANVLGFGDPFPYTLHVRTIAPGPGDPIAVRAENVGTPLGLAVGSTGDLFVGDLSGGRVLRVTSQGAVTTFAAAIELPVQLAFDASGNLLVTSFNGGVYRVTPQGQTTRFITDVGFPFGIAVAPDGRIWISELADRSLRRYSATGQFEARFDAIATGQSGPGPLAIGPSGEPYFSIGTEIWKLAAGQLQRVFGTDLVITGLAFDIGGNIYAATPAAGQIRLFDPRGTVLSAAFAIGPDAPRDVAFGRDAAGNTVARLFATEVQISRVIELNPAGVALPGLPGFRTPPFTPDVAAAALLGGGGLSAADLQYLDAVGNHNGRYDVGDLQAYLRVVSAQTARTRSNP